MIDNAVNTETLQYTLTKLIATKIRSDVRLLELHEVVPQSVYRICIWENQSDGTVCITTHIKVTADKVELAFYLCNQYIHYELPDPTAVEKIFQQLQNHHLLNESSSSIGAELVAGFTELADDLEAGKLIKATLVADDGTTYPDAL